MKYLHNVLLVLILISCSEHKQELAMLSEDIAPARMVSESAAPVQQTSRLLIYEASLTLEVSSITAIYDSVKRLLPAFDAYASTESLVDYEYRKEQHLEIRVAEKKFAVLVERLETLGERVVNREVNSKDVTAEYIDLNARLKTKKQLENRYYEILKQAKTVKDMLEIETQLGVVREEIESMESRIKHINSQVSYSTINLTFSEEIQSQVGFVNQVADAIESGWNSVIQFFLAVLSAWPWVMILLGVAIAILRYLKKRNLTRAV